MKLSFLQLKAAFMIILIVTISFSFSVFSRQAFAGTAACCERTTDGTYCMYTDSSRCDPNYQNVAFQTCGETSFCKTGCCVSSDGMCMNNVAKANCMQYNNFLWLEDTTCNYPECSKGCCVIGGAECSFVTEQKCEKIMTQFPALEMDFRSTGSEEECINYCRASEMGCCVQMQKCGYTTRALCPIAGRVNASNMGFYPEIFCTDPSLNEEKPNKVKCGCESHYEKKCIEGEEDVYWFDSCRNQEGIAEDCDYYKGTLCGSDDEHDEVYCKDTSCLSTYHDERNIHDGRMGGLRLNGESWCIYEGPTGDFKDYPGSRQYRHICINGEEMVEPCRDFRQEVCLQYPLYSARPGSAMCFANGIYDSALNVNITSVPKGGKFWLPDTMKADCNKASMSCEIYWFQKTWHDSWDCKVNCNCQEQGYADDLGKYCRTLGDCGADYNVLGKHTTDAFWVDGEIGAPSDKDWDSEDYKTGVSEGLFAGWGTDIGVFGGMRGVAEQMEARGGEKPEFDESAWLNQAIEMAAISYFTVVAINVIHLGATIILATQFPAVYTTVVTILAQFVPSYAAAVAAAGSPAAVTAATQAAIATVGAAASTTGAAGGGAAAGGAAAGAAAGGTAAVSSSGFTAFMAVVGSAAFTGIAIGVAVLVLIVMFVLTYGGGVEDVSVASHCEPWQPPDGGEDCELCDMPRSEGGILPDIDGKIIPGYSCSEYKCKSLGKTCKFITENEGSGRPSCLNEVINDVNSPKITPWEEILPGGYTIASYPNGFRVNEEVQPYTNFAFGIKTDELAQCKIDDKHTQTYDEMLSYFGNSVYYEKEHNMSIVTFAGKENSYYIRCKDSSGSTNVAEYEIFFRVAEGPDLTAPVIEGTSVQNGAYIPADTNVTSLIISLNEHSICRWSNEDVLFDLMPTSNGMLCNSPSGSSITTAKPRCIPALPLKVGQNEYYIRCKDNAGNVMEESYKFMLRGTEPLTISKASPEGDLFANNVTIQVVTAGGAEGGVSKCMKDNIDFFKTNANYHEQPLYSLPMRVYDYNIKCSDIAGNNATKRLKFRITRDMTAPLIVSIYKLSGNFHVETDENSNCEYSDQSFGIGLASRMIGENTLVHSTPLERERYFVRCLDSSGNIGQEWEILVP